MRESRYRSDRGPGRRSGPPARHEREDVDLFAADLFGERPRSRPRPVIVAPRRAPLPATWSRPDLIFDHYTHRPPDEAEALLGELADEGWSVVAGPRSDVPATSLRLNDVVIQRGLAEGRFASVKTLGQDIHARALYGRGGLLREDTMVLRQ